MKKKYLLLFIFSSFCLLLSSQNKIELCILKGYRDSVLVRFELQSVELESGYISLSPEFEYENFALNYKRYSVNLGYTFKDLIIHSEIGGSVGYGIFDKDGFSYLGFNSNVFVKSRLNRFLKICLLFQATERKDLRKIKPNVLIGVEVRIR